MPFTKITETDLQNKGVIGLPDTPGLSTTEMQEKFDEIALDVLTPKHNGLIDELALSSAAANIGALDVNNDPSTVQAELNKLKQGGYTKAETDALLANKVDTQSGKGLSTNDFTDAYKDKLNGIEDNANNYVLPKGSQTTLGGVMGDGSTFTIDSNGVGHAVGGGGGGTSDYNALINKPKINNVEVIGDKSGSDFGFLSPVITITSDAGSTVKIKKGTTVIDAVPVTTTTWKAVPSDYGTWTVSSTLAGADEATGTVTVDAVKQYSVTVEHITATITATYPNDATYCTCSKGSTTYTATSNPQTFTVRATGTWTVETSLNGIVKSATTTISADGDSQSVTIEYADIEVTYDNNFKGKTITCTNGTLTYTKTAPSDANTVSFTIPSTGTWTVRSEVGGATYSDTVSVVAYTSYSATLALFNATITATFPSGASCVCNGVTATTSPYTFNLGATGTYSVVCTLDGISESTSVTITTDGQTETHTFEYGTINLTFDNEFRGLTLTCTDSSYTITKTAPSTGNTMVFYPNETNTWTISGTYSGVTYTTTAEVSSLSTPVSAILQTIPNGSTATPTDVIQTWLKCAAINDKNYTTLAQVLADTDTFTALLQDSNACDYMARSTTWAVASGLVPTMTSNTTPSGTCSGTSESSGQEYYKAFDGNENTFWQSQGTSAGVYPYLQYTFPETHDFRLIKFMCYKDSNTSALYYKITASSDGTNYSDIVSEQYVAAANLTDKQVFVHQINGNYISFRIYVWGSTFQSLTYASVRELQFYTDADITTDADAMARIGKYDYCSCALLGNSTWASAIAGSSYVDSVLNASVPIMTSNTAPSGECFASDTYIPETYGAWKAFDKSNSTWWSSNYVVANSYIGYKFPSAVQVVRVMIHTYHENYATSVKLQGSNDGFVSDTHDIDTLTITTPDTDLYFAVSNSDKYLYYRLLTVTGSSGATNINYKEIQFYGHTAQTNIIHSAASDTLYYIDGTNQTIGTTDTSGVGTVDWSNVPVGNLTIYSSVANNPDDLTSAYSKTVRITPNTVEVYVMPDTNLLYWYGWEGKYYSNPSSVPTQASNLCNAGTENTNNISLGTISGAWYTVGGADVPVSDFTNFYAIVNNSSVTEEQAISIMKYGDNSTYRIESLQSGLYKASVNKTNATYSAGTLSDSDTAWLAVYNNRSTVTIYAMWCE